MALFRTFLARGAFFTLAALILFQSGCDQLKPQGKTYTIRLGPTAKLKLVYVEGLKLFVGKYEVSNLEFRCFRPAHSSGDHEGLSLNGNNQPVVNVNWDDARAFCEWLTQNYGATKTGKFNFRLPSEKEWEYYATSGSGSEFPWGTGPVPKNWNYFGRENKSAGQMLDNYDGHRVSAPVNKSGINDLGLYGVGGNVWEWCQDDDEGARVLKGASWADCAPLFLKTSRRSSNAAKYKSVNLGFRVVAEKTALPQASPDKPASSDQPAAPAAPAQ